MSGVNVQVSVANVPQFDRHQSDIQRLPVVNQGQNADIARQESAKRMQMPVQADQVEGKKVDPEAKNHDRPPKGKKKRPGNPEKKNIAPQHKRGDSGYMVDIEA